MSISLGRDNRLPSSVFRKSSKQPEEREVAGAFVQSDPTLAGPASRGTGCSPPAAGSGWHWISSAQRTNPPTAAGASALQKLPSQPSQCPGGADLLPAAWRTLGLSQVQGHAAREPEQNLPIPGPHSEESSCPLLRLLAEILPPRTKGKRKHQNRETRLLGWCREQTQLPFGI